MPLLSRLGRSRIKTIRDERRDSPGRVSETPNVETVNIPDSRGEGAA